MALCRLQNLQLADGRKYQQEGCSKHYNQFHLLHRPLPCGRNGCCNLSLLFCTLSIIFVYHSENNQAGAKAVISISLKIYDYEYKWS